MRAWERGRVVPRRCWRRPSGCTLDADALDEPSRSTRSLRHTGAVFDGAGRGRPHSDAVAPTLPLVYRGKVRDLYDAGDDRLLIVASDRLSAFDVVMAEPVPDKGRVLTALSAFWFELLADVAPEPPPVDRASTRCRRRPGDPALAGRCMLVRRCEMLPSSASSAGYLAGIGLEEYRGAGHGARRAVPAGLREADELPEPCSRRPPRPPPASTTRTSPSTKRSPWWAATLADAGARPVAGGVPAGRGPRRRARDRRGRHQVRARPRSTATWSWPTRCSRRTRRGSGRPTRWVPGSTPPSFDKQPVRDELAAHRLGPAPAAARRCRPAPWRPPGPRYVEAYERLTGAVLRRLAGPTAHRVRGMTPAP